MENRWNYIPEIKEKYLPSILEFIEKLKINDETQPVLDLTRSGLAPYHLWKILEELGYENDDIDDNGWEQDFWVTMKKDNAPTIIIRGCGMTFEVSLTREEY
jgi:hypothetical protein